MFDINNKNDCSGLTFQELSDKCLTCTNCSLNETRTTVVFGTGPVPCNLMVIGEGPGEQEDSQGKPFVGNAGQLLTKILGAVGINRENDLYITNIVKCRPPQNRNPFPEEIESCRNYLVQQINLIKPKIIILLGSPALKTILGAELGITRERGKWFTLKVDYMDDLLYLMPAFHPSYLLRNESKAKGSPKWLTWQDMKEVKAALDFYN
jgi:uracil-DNA glycosylase